MAARVPKRDLAGSADVVSKMEMKNEDLQEFSNIFASEFNSKGIHDRVLCFQIIDEAEFKRNDDSNGSDEIACENEISSSSAPLSCSLQPRKKG